MALRISTHSLSSMLGRDRQDRCRWCGNRVEWFETFERSRVPLIPVEFPAARVPVRYRWRVDQGIAYLGSDQGLCRIKHSSVCPMLEHDTLDPAMVTVVDSLRRNMRKLIDRGLFVPQPPPPERTEIDQPDPGAVQKGSTRHVIEHCGDLRVLPGSILEFTCVAGVIFFLMTLATGLLTGQTWNLMLAGRLDEQLTESRRATGWLVDAMSITTHPDSEVLPLTGTGEGQVSVAYLPGSDHVYVMATQLPSPRFTYHVWFSGQGKSWHAGELEWQHGWAMLPVETDPNRWEFVMLTDEPRGRPRPSASPLVSASVAPD
jgi:hypothetical protein